MNSKTSCVQPGWDALWEMVVNHLLFTDDACVFSLCVNRLHRLLNICGDYAAEHEIAFNCKKANGVLFSSKSINNLLHEMFF